VSVPSASELREPLRAGSAQRLAPDGWRQESDDGDLLVAFVRSVAEDFVATIEVWQQSSHPDRPPVVVTVVRPEGIGKDRAELRVMLQSELAKREVSQSPLWCEQKLDHLYDTPQTREGSWLRPCSAPGNWGSRQLAGSAKGALCQTCPRPIGSDRRPARLGSCRGSSRKLGRGTDCRGRLGMVGSCLRGDPATGR
jgi:hypothetical protein